MKKALFLLVCVCAVVFSGCNDENFESSAYVGTYSGTFNIIKQQDGDNTPRTKAGKLHFTQNPVNKENLLWEYCIDMSKRGDGVYETSENNLTGEMLSAATSLIGISEYTDQAIEKILAKAEFENGQVTMKIYYKATILGVEADIVIATFTGTKQ